MEREYDAREQARLAEQLREVERAPLAERRDARSAWRRAIADEPALVAERIGWLLNGSYGQGAYASAWRSVESRGNAEAQLGLLIAALEWACPNAFAREAWRGLKGGQKAALSAEIAHEVERHKRARAQEVTP